MNIIWATRGRTWGFRFLLDGGLADPLSVYEEAFNQATRETPTYVRVGHVAAFRFNDPDGRRDSAGRLIPHEVVVLPPDGHAVTDMTIGMRSVWPLIGPVYDAIWQLPHAPSSDEVQLLLARQGPASNQWFGT